MAAARGCSDGASAEAAARSRSSAETPAAHTASTTEGVPRVMVPVLSSTTVFTPWAVCRASAVFAKMPARAPRPVPTMTAVGVARPSAHGHEMTSTDTACESAVSSPAPNAVHTANVTAAIAMTAGTNTPLILSASFSIGAFDPVASSTMRMMPASAVSRPTRSARTTSQPERTEAAAVTRSPAARSTGTLSPVMADSSTEAAPSTTTPSAGMPAPVRTTSSSPTRTSATGTSSSPSAVRRTAVLGERSISEVTASVVLPFARASKYLPKVISVRIIAADSKYRSIEAMCAASASPAPKA